MHAPPGAMMLFLQVSLQWIETPEVASAALSKGAGKFKH